MWHLPNMESVQIISRGKSTTILLKIIDWYVKIKTIEILQWIKNLSCTFSFKNNSIIIIKKKT